MYKYKKIKNKIKKLNTIYENLEYVEYHPKYNHLNQIDIFLKFKELYHNLINFFTNLI
jgi:hypothetical protein